MRAPGLALALLLTIAVGIGSNASVLGFVRGSVTRGLPIPEVDRIVSLFARDAQGALGPISYEDYLSLNGQLDGVAAVGVVRESQASIELDARESVMSVAAATPDLARLFQLAALTASRSAPVAQPFRAANAATPPAAADGVVISHRVWQIEFDGREDVRGAAIRIDGVETRVADVAPEWLDGVYLGRGIDIWTPMRDTAPGEPDRRARTLWALARLRPGASIDRARATVNARRNSATAIVLLPYTGATPDAASGLSRIDLLLRTAGLAVFFIACANVASFLLARASARSQETSVRVALGASRGQLVGLLLSDSVLISAVGGAFGVLLAVWTMQIVPALFYDQDAGHLAFAPDLGSLGAASAACAVVTIVCGLMPYFELRRANAAAVLQRESAGPSRTMGRLRAGLVVAQMTCCCLLVFSTTVLIKSFRTALRTSVGDRLGRPILATLEWPLGYRQPERGLDYFGNVERAAMSLPDISAAAWIGSPPGSRPAWQPMRIEPAGLALHDVVIDVASFTPQSLALVTLPPIAGRMFAGGDTAEACKVAIVNETAAAELFDHDAVGRSIQDPAGDRVEIVGVVATRKKPDSTAEIRPAIYYYAEQTSPPLDRVGPAIFRVPRRPPPATAVLDANVVSPGYFAAIGVRPIAGTVFSDDPASRRCRVGVVNQEAADRFFGGNAVGAAVVDSAGRRTEIVGVVQSPLLRASQRAADPAIYVPMSQAFRPRMTLLLGAREATDVTLGVVRRSLEAVPGGSGRVTVTTLDAQLSRTALAPERIASVLVGASAAMALTLGVLGLYGAMMEAARQRRREIALRIALGAPGWRVIRQVVLEGARLALAGVVAGTLGSVLVARWMARITSTAGIVTPWVWLAAPLAVMVAVVVASAIPARRALTADPLTIMRNT